MRTDYKDDTFEGNRKYNMISNPDGSVSLVDDTAYTTTGDIIGAAELNDIAASVNDAAIKSVSVATN